jgi:hypothetical protein
MSDEARCAAANAGKNDSALPDDLPQSPVA